MGRTSDAKDRLMQAALSLLWEENYGGVTVDDICKRAEVKKGSFYHFFESKADLAVAAYEDHWRVKGVADCEPAGTPDGVTGEATWDTSSKGFEELALVSGSAESASSAACRSDETMPRMPFSGVL